MRKIITTTFVTMDGVMQAPGGPVEDTSGGFEYGGWMAGKWDGGDKTMDAPDLWVHGSGNLIQTLRGNELVDEMHLWTFPVTIGQGKRLFAEGTLPRGWKLVDTKVSPSGVIIATYRPAGELTTGTVGE